MILVDISQIAISNIMMSPDISKNDINENLIKHMILKSLVAFKTKFGNEFGEIVICCDSRKSWRKAVFPHYKASRKKDRANNFLDWKLIYSCIENFKEDLKQFFPYKVVETFGAEADDIIFTLSQTKEKVLIISSDKDYGQLHKLDNVSQYCPRKKEFIKIKDPEDFAAELIIRGDRSDGIPNIRSDDDTFVTSKRQGPISKKMLEQFKKEIPMELLENWERNYKLISFDKVPKKVQEHILQEFNLSPRGNKKSMYDYFISNKMKSLVSEVGKF